MGFFDLFKSNKDKEETHYDPTNIKVTDLEKGYLLDYDLRTWTVKKMCEYDWGDNYFSREFVLESQGEKLFLHIEDDDELIITISKKLKYRKLAPEIIDHIESKGKPPKQLTHDNITYYLDEESPGYYRDVDTSEWEELISFDYLDEDEEKCLTIEQWDDNDFEVSVGKTIKAFEISNILPSYNQ